MARWIGDFGVHICQIDSGALSEKITLLMGMPGDHSPMIMPALGPIAGVKMDCSV